MNRIHRRIVTDWQHDCTVAIAAAARSRYHTTAMLLVAYRTKPSTAGNGRYPSLESPASFGTSRQLITSRVTPPSEKE